MTSSAYFAQKRLAAALIAAACLVLGVTACKTNTYKAKPSASSPQVSPSSAPSSSTARSASSSAGTAYSPKSGGFTLTYPSGWKLEEGVAGAVCTITSPQSASGAAVNASVTVQQPTGGCTTLYSLNSVTLSRLEKAEKQYSLVANDNIKLSGTVGYKIDYKSVKSGTTQRTVMYFAIINGKEYIFTATAPADAYENYAQDFSDTLKTLVVK